MGRYTKQDVIDLVRENDVEFIRLQFSDLFGTMKNVAITARQLEKALDNKCTFDGSSVDGFVRIEESDMYLYPDLDSFAIFPWNAGGNRVARLICDVYGQDGLPFAGDPRNVLKRVMVECQKMGYKFNVGPECEFFLFHTDEEGRPTTVSHEKAGYFDVAPLDLGESARRDMILNLEDMGFEIEASHHEVAPAQHEIDFKYDNALRTADNILTFKFIVKYIAKRHGLYASFMPKPITGVVTERKNLSRATSARTSSKKKPALRSGPRGAQSHLTEKRKPAPRTGARRSLEIKKTSAFRRAEVFLFIQGSLLRWNL